MPDRKELVALAAELVGKVRAKGHDVQVFNGTLSFPLGVSTPKAEAPAVRGKGLPSFALGVDLEPYADLIGHSERVAIFAEALA